jgi:haloacetate dehalogenase
VWHTRAHDVTGFPLDAGHYLAEERPAETLAALRQFLGVSPHLR